jgi:hypothetical protein
MGAEAPALPQKRSRTNGFVFGLLLFGSYVACFPDLDALSAGDDGAGMGAESGSGGDSGTGGDTGGSGDTGGTAGTEGGGMGGTGNRQSGGTSGTAGAGGEGGDIGTAGDGGTGGTGAEGGECSTDLDVGKPEGNTVVDCGMCGLTCSVRNATRSICTSGDCEPFCQTGFDDCNPAMDNDGCETAITTPTNCGACGEACSLEHVDTARCTNGACAPECDTGFADCNASMANDGCETDANTPENCGACGFVCSMQHAVGRSCNAGRCAPTCVTGYGNCNSSAMLSADDGCETNLDSLTACTPACGGTAVDCDATNVCNLGTCGAPQGVVVFSVPRTAAGQNQRYGDFWGDSPRSLSGETVTVRLYAPGATGGNLLCYFTDSTNFTSGGGTTVSLSALAAGWTDLVLQVGTPSGEYDPTSINQLTMEVTSENTAGPWTDPTVVYVDKIWSSNGTANDPFTTDLATMRISTQRVVAGATMTWSDTVP